MTIVKTIDKYAVKWLDSSDIEQCISLRLNNKKDITGDAFAFGNAEGLRHLLDKQYLTSKPSWCYRAYGLIDVATGELYSYILMKMLTNHRAWVLKLAISNQQKSNKLLMNGLGHVLDACLEYAESKEYFQYYTHTPLDRVDAHDRAWTSASALKKGRYVSILEDVLPPNVVTAFPFYWDDIMSRATVGFTSAIRRVIMLPEHRTFKDATVVV